MRDKSEQSPGQKRCIAEIRAAGGIALCTYLYEHVAQVVELVDNNVDSATINETIDNLQEKLLEKTNVRRQPRTIKRLN